MWNKCLAVDPLSYNKNMRSEREHTLVRLLVTNCVTSLILLITRDIALIIKTIDMKRILIATTAVVLGFAVLASAATFGANLTVGSQGADVTALQTALIAAGYSIPAGATGYFGSQTKSAVQKYQAANSIPATGFVGPLTRAKLNGGVAAAPAATCPVGFTCTANAGTTGTVTNPVVTGPVGITTAGVPGILSVTPGPISTSVLNVGQNMVPVMAIRNQAQYSDIAIQSVTIDLGNNTTVYNKIFSKIYVTDGTNVLASVPLNSSTVVQNGNDYVVGLAGFNFVVPKGTYRDLIVKADLYGAIDSIYTGKAINLSLPGNAVRGVDGAGVNLYGPLTAFTQTITLNPSLVDNAQANVSLDAASPLVGSIPVTDTTNNQYLGLPVLIFDVNAQNDNLHLHNVSVQLVTSGVGQINAAYLFQGSTQIMSSGVSGGYAIFSNITDGTQGANIPVNTTVPYTVKVDATGVSSSTSPFVVRAIFDGASASTTVYNSIDGNATSSGVATGNNQTVASKGPLFTLVGTPSIVKTNITAGGATTTTFQYSATFNVQVQAIGTDVVLGLPNATTTPVAFSSTTAQVYMNGSALGLVSASAGVTAYSQPTNTTISVDGTNFTVARNSSVTIPVTYSFTIEAPGANTYGVQLNSIGWNSASTGNTASAFMTGQPQWRTASI